MNSDDLTKEQIEAIQTSVGRSAKYFKQIVKRMEDVKFDREDGLRKSVEELDKLLYRLSIQLHYLGCKEQVGGNPFRKGLK